MTHYRRTPAEQLIAEWYPDLTAEVEGRLAAEAEQLGGEPLVFQLPQESSNLDRWHPRRVHMILKVDAFAPGDETVCTEIARALLGVADDGEFRAGQVPSGSVYHLHNHDNGVKVAVRVWWINDSGATWYWRVRDILSQLWGRWRG